MSGKKSKFRQTLDEQGWGVIELPSQIPYHHERTVVAGRNWICIECQGTILRGHPYLRTTMGDNERQQQFHTCWDCAKKEGYDKDLPYSSYGQGAEQITVSPTHSTP